MGRCYWDDSQSCTFEKTLYVEEEEGTAHRLCMMCLMGSLVQEIRRLRVTGIQT